MRARTRETSLAMPRRATPLPCALSTSGGSRMDASSSTGTNSIHSTSSSKSAQCRLLASRHEAAVPEAHKTEQPSMPLDKLIAVGLPIALGVVMIGAGAVNFIGPRSIRASFARWGYPPGFHRVTGGLEITAGLLLLIPATSRAGAIGSVVILLAAVMTLIRYRNWTHLPGAVVLTAVAVAAATIRG